MGLVQVGEEGRVTELFTTILALFDTILHYCLTLFTTISSLFGSIWAPFNLALCLHCWPLCWHHLTRFVTIYHYFALYDTIWHHLCYVELHSVL